MEPNLRYSWVSFCLCILFVLPFAVLHCLLILEWMRQNTSSLNHIWEKSPQRQHTWKQPSLGCLFKSPAEPQVWLLGHSKQFIFSWKTDGRGMQRLTPFRILPYWACEWLHKAFFGFPPHNILPCTAWFTSIRHNLYIAVIYISLLLMLVIFLGIGC